MNAVPKQQWVVATMVNGLLIAVFLAGIGAAVWQALRVLDAAEPMTSALFDHGLTSVDVKAPKAWTNQYCGTCHAKEYKQWKASRHAIAGFNVNFEHQCLDPQSGRRQWCLNCHAPNNPGHGLLATEEPAGLEQAFADKPHWLADGVDCLSCHVRDGQVLVTHDSQKARDAHPTRLAPELAKAEFCAGCHQFGFKDDNLPDAFRGHLQQSSLEEFLDFRTAGGFEYRCHECHLPGGDHTMPGGYSQAMLRKAVGLKLSASRRPDNTVEVEIVVSARRVGHRVPGGEHFRYLTLHTELVDADGNAVTAIEPVTADKADASSDDVAKVVFDWPQVESMRRTLGDFEMGVAEAKPNSDTRLWPGERRHYRYHIGVDPQRTKFPLEARTELRYHVMDQKRTERLELAEDTMTSVVYSERLTVTSSSKR